LSDANLRTPGCLNMTRAKSVETLVAEKGNSHTMNDGTAYMSDFLFWCPNRSRPLGRTKPAASRSLGNHLDVAVAAATKLQPRRSTSSAEGRRMSERSVLQRAPGEGIVAVKVKDRSETNFDLRSHDLRVLTSLASDGSARETAVATCSESRAARYRRPWSTAAPDDPKELAF
jgi:hypothetical protein